MAKLVGLSLSECVKDLCAGRVRLDDVVDLIHRNGDLRRAAAVNQQEAWSDFPKAEPLRIMRELGPARLTHAAPGSFSSENGAWLDLETGQQFSFEQDAHHRFTRVNSDVLGRGIPEILEKELEKRKPNPTSEKLGELGIKPDETGRRF